MKPSVLICLLAVTGQNATAAVSPCKAPNTALASSSWKELLPAPAGTVAEFSTPFGWQGLDQAYPSSIRMEHRWRAFLPWGVATTVEHFSGKHPLNKIANNRPVIYLKASTLDSILPNFQDGAVRLSPLANTRGDRALRLTVGHTAFSQKSLYQSRQEVPLLAHRLSDSTLELRPRAALKDGGYLLILGRDGASKYEFSVRCSPI